ncbi:MAG: GTP-binding protein [Pseudomonadota bacterium]
MSEAKIQTNLVTGFLGAGKTTAILHLLAQKTQGERVAVLVNEFGKIGIDGSIFSGLRTSDDGVSIAEVPGGCMCCATGPLTQVALNKLIRHTNPQRLIIEPSGLGHPLEVLHLLTTASYQQVLSLNKTMTLVDARNLSDSRYTEHPTFQQQVAIADIVLGNKEDLYQRGDKELLLEYVRRWGQPGATVYFAQQGAVPTERLAGATNFSANGSMMIDDNDTFAEQQESAIPACGWLSDVNSGEGFESSGWRFAPDWIFSRKKVIDFLRGLKADRAKAVFITDEGIFAYNRSGGALKELELHDCLESRIEIISAKRGEHWHNELFACAAEYKA